jgi:multiple sugar transport system ATP-binding protein
MLAGLEGVDAGSVSIGERDVTFLPPKSRDVAMVFQNYALYPHMSVADNIGFALKLSRVPKAEIRSRVAEAAKMLDLEEYLHRKPKALSGGQRQRVAMGRAIVRRPQVFLLDEPLSNLDAKLRVQTRTQIASLQRRLGVTTVYVTHDQVEAMTLGHRVTVLRDGRLQQCETPRRIYDHPANVFVARFMGSPAMNLCRLPVEGGRVPFGSVTIDPSVPLNGAGEVIVGVRPETLELADDGLDAQVDVVEELGLDAFVYCTAELPGGSTRLVARVDTRHAPPRGERLRLRPSAEHDPHFFAAETGERL